VYLAGGREIELDRPLIVNTYKGKTSDGKIARFTIDANTFSGIIIDGQDHYVIKSVNDFTRGNTETLIAYKQSDIINDINQFNQWFRQDIPK